jgi:hypothetical protein
MKTNKSNKVAIDDFSSKVCIHKGCTKHLKKNLVNKNSKAEYCFKHYPKAKHNRPTGHATLGRD